MEITSWKVRGYNLYSRVEKYQKTNELAQRTSKLSDTNEDLSHKALSVVLFVYFIGADFYPRNLSKVKLGFQNVSQAKRQQ